MEKWQVPFSTVRYQNADEPVFTLRFVQVDRNHLQDKFVTDKLSGIDDLFDLTTDVRSFWNFGSK